MAYHDIQEQDDSRGVFLNKSGIKGLKLPLRISSDGGSQNTTGTINVYSSLGEKKKGVHLSKFMDEILELAKKIITKQVIAEALEKIKPVGEAQNAIIELEFDYFVEKESPMSKIRSPLDYHCKLIGRLTNKAEIIIKACVPVITLCPDSKELTGCAAHNQRSLVTISAIGDVWFDELIHHAEKNASSEIFQILKKDDDRYVMEHAYDKPQFAEDLVREIAVSLRKDGRIKWFSVETENLESNHNYNAYAYMEDERI